MIAFGISAAIAGAGGCAMTYYYYFTPSIGTNFMIFGLIAVCLGGFGSIGGAFIGGMIMGPVCYTHLIGSYRPDRVAAAFHIPERYAPTLVVALGKPDEEITLVPVGEDGDIRYYRDENGHHFVPKRSLEEILIK